MHRFFINTTIFVNLLFMVSGCAPQQPGLQQAKQKWDACWLGIRHDERLKDLFTKVSFDPDIEKPTFQMMTNQSYPTEEDRKAIALWGQMYDMCMPYYHRLEDSKRLSSNQRAIGSSAESDIRILIAELYDGQLTYGDFTKLQQKAYDGFYVDISQSESKTSCYTNKEFTKCVTEK